MKHRNIDLRKRRCIQCSLLHVANNANNRHPRTLVLWDVDSPSDSMANRVFPGPKHLRKLLVDNHNWRRVRSIRIREETAALQRNTERFEISRRNPCRSNQPADIRDRPGVGVTTEGPAFANTQGQIIPDRDQYCPGNLPRRFDGLLVKSPHLPAVCIPARRKSQRDAGDLL